MKFNIATSVSEVILETKVKIAFYSCLVLGILLFSVSILRILNYQLFNTSTYITAALGLLSFVLAFYAKKAKNFNFALYLIHVLFFIFTPIRVYQTGGIDSPAIFAVFTFHLLLAFALNGKKAGYFLFAWYSLLVVFFAYISTKIDLPQSPLLSDPIGMAFIVIWSMTLIAIPVYFVLNEKDKLNHRLRKFQNQEATLIILERVAHEFNNELQASIMAMEFLKREGKADPYYLNIADLKIRELSLILNEFLRMSKREDLVNFLKQSDNEVRIIERLKANAQENSLH